MGEVYRALDTRLGPSLMPADSCILNDSVQCIGTSGAGQKREWRTLFGVIG
jgi:hypothetical protein